MKNLRILKKFPWLLVICSVSALAFSSCTHTPPPAEEHPSEHPTETEHPTSEHPSS